MTDESRIMSLCEVEIDGHAWPLAKLNGAEEPRMLDVHLAERLGYARPRDVRKLIERLVGEGILNDSELCATVAQSHGRPAKEYWLTEEQAILVTTQSKTDAAVAMLKTVVRVFRMVAHGQLPGQTVSAEMIRDAIRAELEPVTRRLDVIEHRTEVIEHRPVASIGPLEQRSLQDSRERLASLRVLGKLSPNLRSAFRTVDNLIGETSGWQGRGCKLSMLPIDRYQKTMACLVGAIRDAQKAADKERNPSLPFDPRAA